MKYCKIYRGMLRLTIIENLCISAQPNIRSLLSEIRFKIYKKVVILFDLIWVNWVFFYKFNFPL